MWAIWAPCEVSFGFWFNCCGPFLHLLIGQALRDIYLTVQRLTWVGISVLLTSSLGCPAPCSPGPFACHAGVPAPWSSLLAWEVGAGVVVRGSQPAGQEWLSRKSRRAHPSSGPVGRVECGYFSSLFPAIVSTHVSLEVTIFRLNTNSLKFFFSPGTAVLKTVSWKQWLLRRQGSPALGSLCCGLEGRAWFLGNQAKQK